MIYHADFEIKYVDEKLIYIIDLDLGNRSVTNDAEYVLHTINKIIPIDNKRVFYRDSMNLISEMIHKNGRFFNFKAIFPTDPLLNRLQRL